MVHWSTWVILIGIILFVWPVPPFVTSAIGVVVIILGVVLRFVGNGDE